MANTVIFKMFIFSDLNNNICLAITQKESSLSKTFTFKDENELIANFIRFVTQIQVNKNDKEQAIIRIYKSEGYGRRLLLTFGDMYPDALFVYSRDNKVISLFSYKYYFKLSINNLDFSFFK